MKTTFTHISKNLVRATILCLIIVTMSCSGNNDDPASFPEQNPLAEYLKNSGFDQTKIEIKNNSNLDFYEFGFSFRPTVKGKINAIVVKIPDEQPQMRVTLWDVSTKTVLKTENIDILAAGQEVTKVITPFVLEKDKEYMITCNTNDWYFYQKTDRTDVIYPIIAGDIQITGFGYNDGITQIFPSIMKTDRYRGDISFKFQQN